MLPRAPGHKENRYIHLFCSPEQAEEIYQPSVKEVSRRVGRAGSERIEALEEKVSELEESFEDLKNQFLAFKQQFE